MGAPLGERKVTYWRIDESRTHCWVNLMQAAVWRRESAESNKQDIANQSMISGCPREVVWSGVDREEVRRYDAPRMASFLWINIWCARVPVQLFFLLARAQDVVIYGGLLLLLVRTDYIKGPIQSVNEGMS
jgi:hypothetical protein